jgi:N-methylhydantoinase A
MPGLFSAFGLLLADTEHHNSRSLRMPLQNADPAALQTALDTMRAGGLAGLARDSYPRDRCVVEVSARARYVGQSSELSVPLKDANAATIIATLPEAFAAEHERSYGFRAPAGEPVELMALATVARGIALAARLPARIPPAAAIVPTSRRAWFADAGWIETKVVDRASLAGGVRKGPLIVQEYDATCLVPPGASVTLDEFGNVVMSI